jgi:hypothetical protein
MYTQRAGCNAGTLTARSLVEAAARDVQAKGRLQPWNSKGWRPEGLVAAAARKQCSSWRVVRVLSVWRGLVAGGARDLEGFKSFKRLKPGKRQAWMPQEQRAMTKQVPHLRWSQAPPLPWSRQGSADFYTRLDARHARSQQRVSRPNQARMSPLVWPSDALDLRRGWRFDGGRQVAPTALS